MGFFEGMKIMNWLTHFADYIIDETLMDSELLIALFSITMNIVISVIGVLPTFFITALNITQFGLELGIAVSVLGESIGAIISFILYRKGISATKFDRVKSNKYFIKLTNAKGKEWIFLLFAFRIVPFIPSSVVTVTAAFSNVHILAFSIISTLGKFPALLLEAMIVVNVIKTSRGSVILMIVATIMILGYGMFKTRKIYKSKYDASK
jgi:uncharacterized membrane protein YdjX (TVP38/TMEM64 family)